MVVFSKHKVWWAVLLVATIVTVVRATGATHPIEVGIPVVGHLLIAFLLAGLPWFIYRLLKKPLTSEQFMWTYTVAWSLFAIPQWFPAS